MKDTTHLRRVLDGRANPLETRKFHAPAHGHIWPEELACTDVEETIVLRNV